MPAVHACVPAWCMGDMSVHGSCAPCAYPMHGGCCTRCADDAHDDTSGATIPVGRQHKAGRNEKGQGGEPGDHRSQSTTQARGRKKVTTKETCDDRSRATTRAVRQQELDDHTIWVAKGARRPKKLAEDPSHTKADAGPRQDPGEDRTGALFHGKENRNRKMQNGKLNYKKMRSAVFVVL